VQEVAGLRRLNKPHFAALQMRCSHFVAIAQDMIDEAVNVVWQFQRQWARPGRARSCPSSTKAPKKRPQNVQNNDHTIGELCFLAACSYSLRCSALKFLLCHIAVPSSIGAPRKQHCMAHSAKQHLSTPKKKQLAEARHVPPSLFIEWRY
jgi:hypothetical protein